VNARLKEVEDRALQLSAEERGTLVEVLISSLEGEMQAGTKEIAAAWDAEIERRVADMEAGRTTFEDAEEALRSLHAHAQERRSG
jgi:putative addiction module component (TIGR02574 family)